VIVFGAMKEKWNPEQKASPDEMYILKLCKKQKMWGFLREHRHLIIDDEIRSALREMYADDTKGGRPPVAPERLALAMLLQVSFGVGDHEVPTLTAMDKRWQMVLDSLGEMRPLFSQGTVQSFRERVRKNGVMKKLLDKTVDLARREQGFNHKQMRTIFDSSPLTGAGKVEDTFNLLGRALSKLVEVVAKEANVKVAELSSMLELSVLQASSIKAGLDIDWRKSGARTEALHQLIEIFERIQGWLKKTFSAEQLETPPISTHLELVEKVIRQDTEPDPNSPNRKKIKQGVAKDRLVSLGDKDMRHGRKTTTKTFNGYKRHVAVDADVRGLICATLVLAANRREHDAAGPLLAQLAANKFDINEIHIDRGYLAAPEIISEYNKGVKVVTKPPSEARRGVFPKSVFTVNFEKNTVTCPADITRPINNNKVTFAVTDCSECPLKMQCTKARQRTVNIHPQEKWYREMAQELETQKGRAARRERIPVEHTLARVGGIQGKHARYVGLDKNQFDLQRVAVVNNCFVLANLLAA
jgi:Transposase DDE domain/Transposase domain (DUF772)